MKTITDLDKILKKIEFLPPFPAVVTKAIQMLKDPKVSTDKIADMVKLDQAISTNVLRLCNSSYYGLNRHITSLNEAVVYIGLSELKEILLLSGTKTYFSKKLRGYELLRGELWRHSLATAIIAENARKLLNVSYNDNIYVSGLLHDVGKLVLSEFVFKALEQIKDLVDKKECDFLEAETKVLSINHAELGARVLKMWNFSEEVITAVKKHHSPPSEEDTDLDYIIRIADAVSLLNGFDTSIDGISYESYTGTFDRYGINDTLFFDRVVAESLDKIQQIEKEYGNFRS